MKLNNKFALKANFRAYHLLLCLTIFVLIWFTGNIAIFIMVSENGQIVSPPLNPFVSQTSSISVLFKKIQHVYAGRSQYYSAGSGRNIHSYNKSTDKIFIFMDWMADNRLFTIDNYKALESILSVYPHAYIRILSTNWCGLSHLLHHIHANIELCQYDSLFENQFLKYRKLGYNIKLVRSSVIGSLLDKHGGRNYTRFLYESVGVKASLELDEQSQASAGIMPYHLITYARILSLYSHGGIFSDFSFFFVGPLQSSIGMHEGFFIDAYCGMSNRGRMNHWKKRSSSIYRNLLSIVQYNNNNGNPMEEGVPFTEQQQQHLRGYVSKCHTSTMLSFAQPYSEILQCVINRYESEAFIECLWVDRSLGGAQCVKKSFEVCFKERNKCNELTVGDSDTHSDICVSNSNGENDKILEVFGRNPHQATQNLVSSSDWVLSSNVRAVWLGAFTWSSSWLHYPYMNGSLSHFLDGQVIHLKQMSVFATVDTDIASCIPLKGRGASNLSVGMEVSYKSIGGNRPTKNRSSSDRVFQSTHFNTDIFRTISSYDTGIEQISKPPALIVAGFQSKEALTLYRAIIQHPNILPSLRTPFSTPITSSVSDDSVRSGYDSHCYNNFFQPGNGESNLLKRMWCFPLIERHERFISVDFDSSYALEPSVPYALSQDNSAVKALFVLLDPVERMLAHYRELRAQFYNVRCDNTTSTADGNSFPSFEDLVLEAMQYPTVFSQVREMITNGTALDFIVHYYFQQLGLDVEESMVSRRRSSDSIDPCGQRRATGRNYDMNSFMPPSYSLFANSVYFPAIVHYLNKLGSDNVRIVFAPTSTLGNRYNSSLGTATSTINGGDQNYPSPKTGSLPLQDISDEVFQFLELCPFEILSDDEDIPPRNRGDASMNRRLEDDDYNGLGERNHSRISGARNNRRGDSPSVVEDLAISISREIFHKLSVFFAPLHMLLLNVTGNYNISIGSPPPFPSLSLSEEYSTSFNESTISIPLLWFEDRAGNSKEDSSLMGRLMPKLIPQRERIQYYSGYARCVLVESIWLTFLRTLDSPSGSGSTRSQPSSSANSWILWASSPSMVLQDKEFRREALASADHCTEAGTMPNLKLERASGSLTSLSARRSGKVSQLRQYEYGTTTCF